MTPLTLNEILRAMNGQLLAAVRSCSITGVSIDSRSVRAGDLFIAIKGRRYDGHEFVREALGKGAVYAVVSDAAHLKDEEYTDRLINVSDTRVALGRLAAYYRNQLSATVIAVTGSNGKTTTKAMIGYVLSAKKQGRCALKSYNNDIGVPLTLLAADAGDDFLTVEVGTNAPGEVDHLGSLVKPDIAVITSVSAAHLEGLGNLEGVTREKLSLLTHLRDRGLAVVNIDQPEVHDRLHTMGSLNLVTFGHHQQADLRVTSLRQENHTLRFQVNDRFDFSLPVLGQHNADNALAAFIVGRRLGLLIPEIISRLSTFELPDMRLQVHQYGSLMVINDSYNANPASMRGAVEALEAMKVPGRRVAIIGDMRELGERAQALHEELGRLIAVSDIDVLMSVGDYSEIICQAARSAGHRRLELHATNSLGELSDNLRRWLKPKDTVLIKGSRALQLEKLLDQLPRGESRQVGQAAGSDLELAAKQ